MKKLTNMKESRMYLSPLDQGFRLPLSGFRFKPTMHSQLLLLKTRKSNGRVVPTGSRTPTAGSPLAHRNYRHPIQQKLRPGDNDLVPSLDAILHFVIIAHSLPDRQRFLPGYERSAILWFGDEREILPPQARHGQDRNFGILVSAPHQARPD